ncbi:MAG TPA: hypothetical protein VGD40_21245 [Chryseosolibacter sp.]
MKRNLRYITIFFGCLLAVVIVCSQVYSAQAKLVVLTEQATDDTTSSEGESGNATISMATFSLPAPVSVQINLDPHCLFEIVFEDVKEEISHTNLPSIEEKLMVTLFRVIISPNAP